MKCESRSALDCTEEIVIREAYLIGISSIESSGERLSHFMYPPLSKNVVTQIAPIHDQSI